MSGNENKIIFFCCICFTRIATCRLPVRAIPTLIIDEKFFAPKFMWESFHAQWKFLSHQNWKAFSFFSHFRDFKSNGNFCWKFLWNIFSKWKIQIGLLRRKKKIKKFEYFSFFLISTRLVWSGELLKIAVVEVNWRKEFWRKFKENSNAEQEDEFWVNYRLEKLLRFIEQIVRDFNVSALPLF